MTKEVNKQNQQQQQSVRKTNQIKKYHGNRQLQSLKRRYRSKGMNDQAIEMLLKFHQANRSSLPDHSKVQEKNINDSSILKNTETVANKSMLFENQNHTNQCENTNDNLTVSSVRTQQKTLKRYNMSTDHWKQTSQLIPNYKQLSPYQFKHMLMKTISNEYHGQIEPLLNNVTVIEFFQQRCELMCSVFQLKIEQDYWNYVENLNSPVVAWLSQVSKDVKKQNFINWDHTKTKENIAYRQQIINNKLEQAEINLFVHFQQTYPLDWQIQNEDSMVNSLKIIYNGLAVVLHNSLYYFQTNFEQKKILLNFDIHDAYLVKSFYDLNPTQEQIAVVQKIWRTNVKSSKKLLNQKKKNSKNGINSNHGFEQQSLPMPSTEIFNSIMRTIIEARQKNIQQRTIQITKFITTIDDNDFLQ